MQYQHTRRGFTLIELLVVVLIIGILAAAAVPQYQKAVYKSRYANLKTLTTSIAHAQEVYFLANGTYTNDWDELDISLPAGDTPSTVVNELDYNWGRCYLQLGNYASVLCQNSKINMAHQIHYRHSTHQAGKRVCYAYNGNINSAQGQVCLSETGSSVNKAYNVGTAIVWDYID